MSNITSKQMPELFSQLMDMGCLRQEQIYATEDGFFAATAALADMLLQHGIATVPSSSGDTLETRLFFDDWYLYAVFDGSAYTYSLFKMREQEYDAKMGRKGDGDIPGVTVSFIRLQTEMLLNCLTDPSHDNRALLNKEINRVVAYRGQNHCPKLKRYFVRTEAQGAYLIANLYTAYIASLAQNGSMPVPECYAAEYKQQGLSGRLPQFIEANNAAAGRVICNHEEIYISNPPCPSEEERLAILATHCANTSLYSFAAEVQFHAKFLVWWAKLPLPFSGHSPYASAIRADMSIGDAESTGPTPYYRNNSRIVKKQYQCHGGK